MFSAQYLGNWMHLSRKSVTVCWRNSYFKNSLLIPDARQTYTQRRNTNGDWIEDDVEKRDKSGDPEREDQKDDQPDDEPKSFCHVFLREVEKR